MDTTLLSWQKEWLILENKGKFEESHAHSIREYRTNGLTVKAVAIKELEKIEMMIERSNEIWQEELS